MEAKDTVMDIDKYLAEMGWITSKDGIQYAWLKQALERQAEISFPAGIREVVGFAREYIPEHHNLCYGVIDPHPDCACCKWQAKLKEWGM